MLSFALKRFKSEYFVRLRRRSFVGLVVVDDAHCVPHSVSVGAQSAQTTCGCNGSRTRPARTQRASAFLPVCFL